jgi:hypothetical protein
VLSKYIFLIVKSFQADPNLQVVCLVSALGLALSVAVLPHSKDQLRTRPLLYAYARGGD